MTAPLLLAGLFLSFASVHPHSPAVKAAHAPRTAVKSQIQSTLLLSINFPTVRPPAARPLQGMVTVADDEREYVTRINEERVQRGLNALTLDPLLLQVARGHSREMCDCAYFDHHSPTPGLSTPLDRFRQGLQGQEMPRALLVGENIFYCSISDDTYNVAYGHQALMDSPGHRANILDPRFSKVGVGLYHDAQGQVWVTEMFLGDGE